MSRRRRRLRITVAVLAIVGAAGIVAGFLIYRMTRPREYRPGEAIAEITSNLARDLPAGAPQPRLTDVTVEAGLGVFRSFAGARSSQLPEDMGSGAAWGDYDNDGDDDLFLVSCGGALGADPSGWAPSLLFENRGDGTFRNVTGFPETRIVGMGAAWGDADGDGWLDLVVTGYDAILFFRNEMGSLVRDTRIPSPPGCWAGATWGDFDNDRDLDLYVSGYVRYVEDDADRARASRQFGTAVPYTLNPSSYTPERNLLFRNDGGTEFPEVAGELGVANEKGRSLGAIWHDFDEDGRLDLYVANDVSDNVLYRNLGNGFEEISHSAWVADYRGAMGLAVGDYNRDGDDDLFVTHWIAQENGLYDSLAADFDDMEEAQRVDGLRFVDVASGVGLGQSALQMIGWGAEFADLDNDGWLDLLVANGSTFETDDEPKRLKPMPSFLYWNRQGEYFHDLTPYVEAMSEPRVSRGLACADYDRDGDLDVVIMHRPGGAQLLRNDMSGGNSIQLRLRSRGRDGRPTGSGEGTTIVATAGEAVLRRTVGSASYLSQSTRTVHLGLGQAAKVDRLEVRWLGGERATYTGLAAGGVWEITEGEEIARRVDALPGESAGASMTERERVVEFWAAQRAGVRAMKIDRDLPAAITLFREALALDPGHEDARYFLANCLASTGDAESAMRELETLVELSPRSHRALKRLGVLRAVTSSSRADMEEAMGLLDRALAINREETGVLLVMGEIALFLGDHEMADERLEWACRTNPRAVSGFFLRGYVAWAGGDDASARSLLAQAGDARGEEWKPEGTTAEGDTAHEVRAEATPLSRFWREWDGSPDPAVAFATLHERLEGAAAGDSAP